MSWLYRREASQLLSYDRQISESFDASIFVSANEAKLFKQLAPESEQQVTHLNNGVDYHYFDPTKSCTNPYQAGPILAFTGGFMDSLSSSTQPGGLVNCLQPLSLSGL